jgi:hypothetical protein
MGPARLVSLLATRVRCGSKAPIAEGPVLSAGSTGQRNTLIFSKDGLWAMKQRLITLDLPNSRIRAGETAEAKAAGSTWGILL